MAGLISFLPLSDACGQGDQVVATSVSELREIKQAWVERRQHVKSLDLSAVIKRTTPGSGIQPKATLDPFSDPRPKNDLVATINAEYYCEGGKVGVVKHTDKVMDSNNPDKLVPQTYHAAFDGTANRSLIVQTALPMGSIEIGKTPSRKSLVDLDFLAVGLWLQPRKVLDEVGWSTRQMTLDQETIDVEGVRCRRVHIPRGQTDRWSSALDLDPNRSWVPVQYQSWFDGNLSISLSIKYADENKVGPVVKEWVCIVYTQDKEKAPLDSLREGKVKSCRVNSDIDDPRFAIKFPFGTHVSKNDGEKRTYLIQREDGLRPIKEEEFGRTRPAENDITRSEKI